MEKKLATLFSGGGLFDVGANLARYKPIWGIDNNAEAAVLYKLNHPNSDFVFGDIHHCLFDDLAAKEIHHIHASPSCKSASSANAKKGEKQDDIASAQAIVRALQVCRPETFTLENVASYLNFDSFKIVLYELKSLGYDAVFACLNLANFGVPQRRRRLILSASRISKATLPRPTHHSGKATSLLKSHLSWWSAVHDLFPTFKEVDITRWQAKRSPPILPRTPFLLPKDGANTTSALRPILGTSLCGTVRSLGNRHSQQYTVGIPHGNSFKFYKLPMRALARLQTVPDSYVLADSDSISCQVIGNGVPCKFAEALMSAVCVF